MVAAFKLILLLKVAVSAFCNKKLVSALLNFKAKPVLTSVVAAFKLILLLRDVVSKVLEANCIGVTYLVLLSAILSFLSTLAIKFVVSNLTPFNCVGVAYTKPLSAKFTFESIAALIFPAVKDVILEATNAFTIFA